MTLSGQVQRRLLGAAMVPVGLLLGPLVLIFLWLPLRIDPAVKPPPVGSPIIVKASVQGDYTKPVTLEADRAVMGASDATQAIPPIREALEQLRQEWVGDRDHETPLDLPWSVLAAGDAARAQMLASLDQYLAGPIPPQTLAWVIRSPDEPGVYAINLKVADYEPVLMHFAVGERSLPQSTVIELPDHPLRSVEIAYPPKREQDLFFWCPFRWAGFHLDIGWLGVYLGAYLPTMLLARSLLRTA